MADMKKGEPKNYPLNPEITMIMNSQPVHNNFSRYLTFEDHNGATKRLKVKFKKKSGLTWEVDSFPNGISNLKALVDPGNRSYWDRLYLENRGGSTLLPIKNLKIVMNYNNPPGSSPHGSNHVVNGLDFSLINHAKIPIVD